MRLLGILIVVGIVGLLGWQIIGNRVDQSNPDEVATAFTKALRGEKLKKAAEFWVPDAADAWQQSAAEQISQMRGDLHAGFISGLPTKPVFTSSRTPKSPENEQTLTSGDFSLDLRQIDGKWYVCRGPL